MMMAMYIAVLLASCLACRSFSRAALPTASRNFRFDSRSRSQSPSRLFTSIPPPRIVTRSGFFTSFFESGDTFRMVDMQVDQVLDLILNIREVRSHFIPQHRHIMFVHENPKENDKAREKASQEEGPELVAIHT